MAPCVDISALCMSSLDGGSLSVLQHHLTTSLLLELPISLSSDLGHPKSALILSIFFSQKVSPR